MAVRAPFAKFLNQPWNGGCMTEYIGIFSGRQDYSRQKLPTSNAQRPTSNVEAAAVLRWGAICWMLHVGRWTLDVERWTLDVGRWTLDVERWTLDVGRWTLD